MISGKYYEDLILRAGSATSYLLNLVLMRKQYNHFHKMLLKEKREKMQIKTNSEAMIVLLSYLMNVDRKTDMRELEFFNDITQYAELTEERMIDIVLSVNDDPALFDEAIATVTDPEVQKIILMALRTMISSDKEQHPFEKEFLNTIVQRWKAK